MICIALIAGSYHPKHCGVAHYTAHLREALSHHHVKTTVLTTHTAASYTDDSTVKGVVKDWQLNDLMLLVQAIHQTKADLLHIQHAAGTYGFDRSIFLLPLWLKLTGWRKPIVTTVHEYGWWEWQPPLVPAHWIEWLKVWGQQRGWWDREDGFLLTQSDAILTTNHDAEQAIYDRLPHLKSIVHRIPIAANVDVASTDIDQAQAHPQARRQVRQALGWAEDTAIVAFFGFLHPVKGLETLLPAFQQVVMVHPQARLLLIGGVETLALPGEQATRYWNHLQATCSELGLATVVHMTGYLDAEAVSHYLMAADLGVLPFNHGVTLKSGSLLTLMAHALPVVATYANPPDPELSQEPLVEAVAPRDKDGLAAALSNLLSHPSRRQHLSQAGHAFSDRFTWSGIAHAHLDVYRTVLSGASY